ncbi:TetR family transcriptional regulator [Mycobacterium sp. EPa45]|nr:TetR/AcrR family transcriptional regulator [Mycobacterium sp. EPa45]AKK30119.1 TetR family transcriptional regulator [Mycobacterium sp. EPa45]
MAPPRRTGSPDATTRKLLLDAAEELLIEGGYSAITGRAVAKKAGLKSQLVPYHFGTMDDLFLAVFRRRAEQGLERHRAALKSDQPLWALWRMSTDPRIVVFTMEFVALANHRRALKQEIAYYVERMRDEQVKALSSILEGYGIPPEAVPPEVVMTMMFSVSGVLAIEESLGVELGHSSTLRFSERWIRQYEGDPPVR